MADAVIFQIEQGVIAFEVVDTTEVGYDAAWLAPGGATVDTAVLTDYEADSASWQCQATSGALTATQDTTTVDVPATFCNPARSIPQPAQTSYSLDLSFLQDPNVAAGLSAFLFEHDTEEAYVLFGMGGEAAGDVNPPKLIGRVRLVAGTIGGAARTTLTADVSLPLSSKPQIMFGTGAITSIIPPSTTAAATGATAGTPGTWTPPGSTPPANAAGATTAGVVASPTTAWTTGQYVQGSTAGTGGEMHWSGTAWATGRAS